MKDATLTFIGRDSGFGDNNNSAYFEDGRKFTLIDCGCTVFNQIKQKIDFNKYDYIDIIITHLHNDHAGSLGQMILYTWYLYNKKVTIISKCEKIREYLEIVGISNEMYILKDGLENLEFIKTEHTKFLDAYGFKANFNNKNIIYTGDTSILEPFLDKLEDIDEFYIDVSKFGGAHLKIDDILNVLEKISENNTKIFLMHLDDKKYIKSSIRGKYNIEC